VSRNSLAASTFVIVFENSVMKVVLLLRASPSPQGTFHNKIGLTNSLVSPRQTSIYVKSYLGSRYMKSVIYHALRTVSENAYVKCGL